MTEKSEMLAEQAKSAEAQAGSGPTIELVTDRVPETKSIMQPCYPTCPPPCQPVICPVFCPPRR